MTPAAILTTRRILRTTALTFGLTLVAAAIGFAVISSFISENVAPLLVLLLAFPFIVAAGTLAIGTLVFMRHLTVAAQGRERREKLGLLILRGRDTPLDDDERAAAARYAQLVPTWMAMTLGHTAFMATGFTLLMIGQITVVSEYWVAFAIAGAAVLLSACVSIPITARRYRRAQRYAAAHPA